MRSQPLSAAPVVSPLPNGFRVVSSDEPGSGRVAVMLMVRAGDVDDPESAPGAMRVLGRILLEPANHRAPGRFQALDLDGGITVITEEDVTTFTIVTLPEQATSAVRMLAATIETPVWNNTTLIRDVKREATDERDGIPSDWERDFDAWRARTGLFVPSPPSPDTVPRETLRTLYESRYKANAMVLTMVGDLRGFDAKGAAERSFGSLAKVADTVPKKRRMSTTGLRAPSGVYAFSGFKAPPATDPLAPAVEVLAAAMGMGKTSAIFQVLREKEGVGYESGVVYPRSLSPTGITLYARSPGNAVERRDELMQIWKTARLNERENWDTARARAVHAYASVHQTVRDRAYWLAFWELAGKGAAWDAGYSEAMRSVLTESLQEAAVKYLSGSPVAIP